MLPEDNVMPSSLYEARKSLSTLGIKYEKIHACPKDCILYRNEHANLVNCPTCGSSRWKVVKKGKIYEGVPIKEEKICEGVPAKVLWYFPPIPRFQRMFRIKDMANNLTWHARKRVCDGYLRHPADAPAWKLVDEQWPDFAKDPRSLRLALSADGINPHSLQSFNYSCWPIILITYNLPPWLCMKRRHMMLTLLVSGPRQPGNDIDVYIAPLIDDLKQLWELGVETYDAYRDANFTQCQQQPDEKQCGFYVMRYMRDIIENRDSLPIPLLFSEGFYSKTEIDEVRTEWCGVVQDFID